MYLACAVLTDCGTLLYTCAAPQYADSSTYMAKFRQLQARAMGAVRTKVQQVLKHAAQQVQVAVQEAAAAGGGSAPAAASGAKPAALAEGAEVSLLYVRFRAAAEPSLKGVGVWLRNVEVCAGLRVWVRVSGLIIYKKSGPSTCICSTHHFLGYLCALHSPFSSPHPFFRTGLFHEIEGRCMRPEYQRLLEECQTLYCQARLQLISPFVQQRVEALAAQALPLLARNGCEHLLRVRGLNN